MYLYQIPEFSLGITPWSDAAGQSLSCHPCTKVPNQGCSSATHPAEPLTWMKCQNWDWSKLLVSALLSLLSASASLLYTKAAVAKAFSRSEPFLRAIIERNLLEPSWVGGNLRCFIKVNETETVYTHRGSGPDFIWSGPATCLISHAITPWRKLSFRAGAVSQHEPWDPPGPILTLGIQ